MSEHLQQLGQSLRNTEPVMWVVRQDTSTLVFAVAALIGAAAVYSLFMRRY